ncbi:MAG: hypothetical protein WCE54_14435 [Ignavibacteriaceae bacterium]
MNAEITNPESIKGCCEGCDTVISSVGITRQKDVLTISLILIPGIYMTAVVWKNAGWIKRK